MYLYSVNATVRGNVIRGNTGCNGTGISTLTATATIEYNQIVSNYQEPTCNGGSGGGIMFRGDGLRASAISSNLIAGHLIGGYGAGIYVQGADRVTIEGNVIRDNQANAGGGVVLNLSSGTVNNNVLLHNTAETGGGITLFSPVSNRGMRVTGNLLFGNQATLSASGIQVVVSRDQLRLTGNTVTGASAVALVRCELPFEISPTNALLNTAGPTTEGFCESRH